MSSSCGRGCVSHLSYQVACNMSPLGSRRGPALRAESGGVRPLCQIPKDLLKAEVIRSLGFDPWRAYAIPPTRGPLLSLWLLKVAISLQRGAIFRQVAFKLPSSCHLVGYVGPSCLQDGSKTPQHRNLTPTWTQLGPTWPHLRLTLIAKMSILCGRDCISQLFADMRLKMSEVTSRWPREAPR